MKESAGPTWADVLSHWALIEADFQEHYGSDLGSRILSRRSGRWLRTRILGLFSIESRLRAAIMPREGGSP